MNDRGTGRTTQQMKEAPPSAVFVWCNGAISYPQALAKSLGRDDLVIRPRSWLRLINVIGRPRFRVVVDHATHFDHDAREALDYLRVSTAATGDARGE
jgi:hypothetical protein